MYRGLCQSSRHTATPEAPMTRARNIDDHRLTIRHATPADAGALARLAALDSKPVPAGGLLVAEVGGELWAAVSLSRAQDIADPFRPSGELVFLLHQRAAQVRREAQGLRRRRLALRP